MAVGPVPRIIESSSRWYLLVPEPKETICWMGVPRAACRLFVSLFATFVVGCSPLSAKIEGLVGKPAPDARLMFIDGPEKTISSEKGKYIALIFWATWCNYSKSAMDEIEELAKRYKHRDDVKFFAVSIDRYEDFEKLKSRIASQKLYSLKHAFSGSDIDDEAYTLFNGESIPYAVLIDPRGVVRYVGISVSGIQDILESRFGE